VTVEARCHAATVECDNEGSEKAMPHGRETGDVLFTKSRQSPCDTCVDGMDMEECLRKIQYLEVKAKETRNREHNLMQQLYEARACIIEKGQEVCNLQNQIAQELSEKQGLLHDFFKRDLEILRLQKSRAVSQAGAIDVGDRCAASKTAAESCFSSKVESSNIASGARSVPASNSRINPFPQACGLILPTLPEQDTMFSPQIMTCVSRQQKEQPPHNNVRWMPPSSPSVCGPGMLPNCSTHISLRQQFQIHTSESLSETMARQAVADVKQIIQELHGMPAPFSA